MLIKFSKRIIQQPLNNTLHTPCSAMFSAAYYRNRLKNLCFLKIAVDGINSNEDQSKSGLMQWKH